MAFLDLKQAVKDLENANGGKVGQALAWTFVVAAQVLRQLIPIVGAVADSFKGALNIALAFFNGSEWATFSTFLQDVMSPVVSNLTQAFFSLLGSLFNLTRAFYNLGGSQILDMIVQSLKDFDEWTSKLASNQGFIDFMNVIIEDIPPVMQFLGALFTFIMRLIDGLSPLGNLLLNAFSAMFMFLNSMDPAVMGPLVLGVSALILALMGLGAPAIIVGILAVASAFTNLYEKSEPFRAFVDAIGNTISQWWTPLWNNLVNLWQNNVVPAWDNLVKKLSDPAVSGELDKLGQMLMDKVLPAIGDLAETIVKDVIPAVINFLAAAGPFLGFFLSLAAESLITMVTNFFYSLNGAIQTVADVLNVISDILNGDWGKMWQDAGKAILDLGKTIAGAFGVDGGTYDKAVQDFLDQTSKNWDDTFGSNGSVTKTWNDFLSQSGKNWDEKFGPQGSISTSLNSFNTTTNGMFSDFFTQSEKNWDDAFGPQGSISTNLNSFNTTTNGMFSDMFTNIKNSANDFFTASGQNWDSYFGPQGSISTQLNNFNTTTNGMFKDMFKSIDDTIQERIDGFMSSPAHAYFVKFGEDSAANWDGYFGPEGSITKKINAFLDQSGQNWENTFGSQGNVTTTTNTFLTTSGSNWDQYFGPTGSISTQLNNFNTTTNGMFSDLFTKINEQSNIFFTTSGQNWDALFGPTGTISTQLNNFNTTTNGMFSDLFTKINEQANIFFTSSGQNWDHYFGPQGTISTQLNNFNTTTNGMFSDLFKAIGDQTSAFLKSSGDNWNGYFGPNGSISTALNQFNKNTNGMFNDLFTTVGDRTVKFVNDTADSLKKIGNAFRDPINWVINNVFNAGIVDTFNNIMTWLGQKDRIGKVPEIPAFAMGGEVPMTPGAVRGQDSVLIKAMPGEFVLSTKDVDNLGGPSGVERIRSAVRGYASGGIIVPPGTSGSAGANTTAQASGTVQTGAGIPILGDMIGWATSKISAVLGSTVPGMENAVHMGMGLASKVSTAVIQTITDKVNSAIQAALAAAMALIGIGNNTGTPAGRAANVAAVQSVAARYGWGSGAQWDALVAVINRESGFNNVAQNPTSTAYGMFQFLDSTWGAYGATKTSDPAAQSEAGLRYISQRYGSPQGALAHEQQYGWYDAGGVLNPGITMAINHSGKPEAILTNDQWNTLRDATNKGGPSNSDVVAKLDELKEVLAKGTGNVNVYDTSGNPVETARLTVLSLKMA
jgi:SLT domain-containing protein